MYKNSEYKDKYLKYKKKYLDLNGKLQFSGASLNSNNREPEILKNAVPRMSEATKQLAIVHCNDFSEPEDPLSWGGLNRTFHQTLYVDSTQSFTKEVADNAMDLVDRYIRAQLVVSDGMEKAKSEHTAILEAALSGNGDLAAKLLRKHILGAKESLLASFSALS